MHQSKLRPRALAESLDLWALRREKVIELLDIKAAKRARELARMCRELARVSMEDPAWDFQWMAIRAAAAALLERHRSVPPPPNGLAPAALSSRAAPPLGPSVSGTSVRVDELPNSERPTRVAATVWSWHEDAIKVA
ncbi:MAG: hypothetical protein JNK04_13315 [Myxococcales bacterium]|nr:hypothetical protein [Myxococcales bacterium]